MESLTRNATVINIHSIGYEGVEHRNHVEYHFMKLNQLETTLPISFHRYIRKLSPDVVIVRGLGFPLQILFLRWQLGEHVKIMAQHHADKPSRGYKKLLQRIADKFIGAYFFSSMDLAKPWLNAELIHNKEKIKETLVLSSTFFRADKISARNITGVQGKRVYLWVGGLDANKDPITLVNAFKKFSGDHVDAHLYMIYQEEDLLDTVKELVAHCSHIHLMGALAHNALQSWYNAADFIISTSHYEGMGVAVCEGLSCGCIPILSDIPSFRMMTNQGEFGFLFPPGNADALLHSLQDSWSMDLIYGQKKVLHHHEACLSSEASAFKIMETVRSL